MLAGSPSTDASVILVTDPEAKSYVSGSMKMWGVDSKTNKNKYLALRVIATREAQEAERPRKNFFMIANFLRLCIKNAFKIWLPADFVKIGLSFIRTFDLETESRR